jgi:uncharacterized phage protein gp47/JayE
MLISVDDLVALLSAKVTEKNPNIVTRRGSVVHDSFLIPSAASLAWNSALLEFTRACTSLDTILLAKVDTEMQQAVGEALNLSMDAVVQLLSDSIDRIAANYGLTRKPAQKASGLVHFYVSTAPGSDIQVASGTRIETAQKTQFITTATVVLVTNSISAFYDPVLNAYAVAAPIEAVLTGPGSNVGAGTIIYATNTIPTGFTGLSNKYAIANGYDTETDEQLVDRIKVTLRGSNLETKSGIESLVLNNTTVRNVFVADAQSPYQYRNNGKGGVVDVYTTDVIPALISDTYSYTTNNQLLMNSDARIADPTIAPNLPAIEILSISTDTPAPYTFQEGVDYVLTKDTSLLTGNSARALDSIQWLGAATPTTTYTVEYVYNQAVTAVQALLMDDNYRPLMGDITSAVLVKEGTMLPVEISYQIVVLGGYSRSQVAAEATNNIQAYVNALGFGDSLAQSDIINVIENTRGVNYVNATPLAFNITGQAIAQVLSARDFEYLRTAEITIL